MKGYKIKSFHKLKIPIKFWNILIVLILSFIVAFVGVRILEANYSPKVINPFDDIPLSVDPFVESSGYFCSNKSVAPGYFCSSASIYAFTYSPYADIFNFTLELSTDNSTWITIPLIKSQAQPQDYNQFVNLGSFVFDKPTITIVYGRYMLPAQNVSLPSGVTPYDILESVEAQILFKQQQTPRDQMLKVLVFITLFSVSISIIRFIREEWNKKES